MTIKQLSVFIENKTGRINEVTRILGDNNVNMRAFSLVESADFGIMRMIVSDIDRAAKALKEAHFGISVTDVVQLCVPDTPGAMAKVLEYLAKENIFIEYMYAFAQEKGANVIIRPTDVERCVDVLTRYKGELLYGENAC